MRNFTPSLRDQILKRNPVLPCDKIRIAFPVRISAADNICALLIVIDSGGKKVDFMLRASVQPNPAKTAG